MQSKLSSMAAISIVEEKEFPLLNRKNFLLKMEFPKKPTPSAIEIKKEAASFLKAEENRIAIKNINQQFGANSALITIHLYKDEKTLKDTEEIKKKKKKGEEKGGQETKA